MTRITTSYPKSHDISTMRLNVVSRVKHLMSHGATKRQNTLRHSSMHTGTSAAAQSYVEVCRRTIHYGSWPL